MHTSSRRTIKRKLRIEPTLHQVDMLGVVHNAEYIRWFDEGRFQLVCEVVSIQEAIDAGVALMVVENHCAYKKFVRLGDALVLYTTHVIKPAYEGRFVFEHSLVHEKTKIEMARGNSALVAVEYRTHQLLRELPPFIWERYCRLK
ncbi:MAG: hypothetical protein GF418_03845 [Chitinivibrionales bacterium]|nr:hypothetical protein [Chitinivibrionales bacterium]